MKTTTKFTLLAVLVSLSAFAEVGKVAALEGEASRTPKGGKPEALAAGANIELGDTLTVKGNLKFELNDGSVIMLAPNSTLEITEADFEGQERKGFKGLLKAGSLWTKVKKALGGGGFEVSTERAVAGVRGTIFRIDADALVKAAKSKQGRKASIVRVIEGSVGVNPTKAVADSILKQLKKKQGPRVEVAGPKEVTADEWEKIFVALSANQQIAVGVDLWEQAEIEEAVKKDAFAKWIEKNQ
ncbi:MAG: FecR family protein [Myxococcaceae bacterium]